MSTETTEPRPGIVARGIVAILAGALYTYPVWSAIGNLVNIPVYFHDKFGVDADRVPWFILWAGLIAPIVIYLVALVLSWKRGAGAMALVLTTGFAVNSAIGLSLLAFEKDIEIRLVIEFLLNR